MVPRPTPCDARPIYYNVGRFPEDELLMPGTGAPGICAGVVMVPLPG